MVVSAPYAVSVSGYRCGLTDGVTGMVSPQGMAFVAEREKQSRYLLLEWKSWGLTPEACNLVFRGWFGKIP